LDQLQRLQFKLKEFQYTLSELFLHKKINSVQIFADNQKKFVSNFGDLYPDYSTQNFAIKMFMFEVSNQVSKNELWKKSTNDEIITTIKLLERNLMAVLFDYIFQNDERDFQLQEKMNLFHGSLTLTDFEIPKKFHSESPWSLAQAELRNMNLYRAPYDKFLCISKCWEILSHYVSLLDDPAPDSLWPIMAWCIHSISMNNINANIEYIRRYTKLV